MPEETHDLFLLEENESSEVGMTPLIDVVFQLLVFFMLTSTFVQPSLELNLPRLSQEQAITEEDQSLRVEVSAEGSIHLNGEKVASLRKSVGSPPQKERARLFIDANTPYQKIAEVLRELGQAGVHQIQFVYEADNHN